MSGIVTFGEIMMRLQPPSFKRLAQAESFDICYGGSEANTAAALAQWGENAAFVTRLPDNELGEACIRKLRSYGVDVSYIKRGDGRMGLYFVEKGISLRPPQVLYDRKNSSFALSGNADYDFKEIFKGADWLHFSGITPALGGNIFNITKSAVEVARREGLRISCDFNYRAKLWSIADARAYMTQLIEGIDVLIINENQLREVYQIETTQLEKAAAQVSESFGIDTVILTERKTLSGEVNEFSALLSKGEKFARSRTYSIYMAEKIGGGDAFSAGIIYCILNGRDIQETVDFATAAACFKHTVEGDMITASVSDIEWIMNSDGRGRMVR